MLFSTLGNPEDTRIYQALDGSGLGAGYLDQPATARFCAFSRSEDRTKLEFNQHCMDSMTSLR